MILHNSGGNLFDIASKNHKNTSQKQYAAQKIQRAYRAYKDPHYRSHPTEIIPYIPLNHQQTEENMHPLAAAALTTTIGATTGTCIKRWRQNNLPLSLRRDVLPIGLSAGFTFTASSFFITAINPAAIIFPCAIAGGLAYLLARSNNSQPPPSHNNTFNSEQANQNHRPPPSRNNDNTTERGNTDNQETVSEVDSTEEHKSTAVLPRLKAGWKHMFCKKDTTTTEEPEEEILTEADRIFFQNLEKEEEQRKARHKKEAEARARRKAYEASPQYLIDQQRIAEEKKRKEEEKDKETAKARKQWSRDFADAVNSRTSVKPPHQQKPRVKFAQQQQYIPPPQPKREPTAIQTKQINLQQALNAFGAQETVTSIMNKMFPQGTSRRDFETVRNKAFNKLAFIYHPDKNSNKQEQAKAVMQALENLKDITFNEWRKCC